MKKYYKIIQHSILFKNISDDKLEKVLNVLNCRKIKYQKNSLILKCGQSIDEIGLVLDGSVIITKEDFWGNSTIISQIYKSEIFGESYACTKGSSLTVNAIAETDCEILFIKISDIISPPNSHKDINAELTSNLISLLSAKNLMLNSKIEYISQRKTRDKILSYLSDVAKIKDTVQFEIPFSRQQLADFLAVDRSALSAELSKLKREGIIDYTKNRFTLL